MPMPARAAIAVTATGGSMAFQRFITTANDPRPGSNLHNEAGLYGIYWSLVVTGNAGSSLPPIFTWYDDSIGAGITATAGVMSLLGQATAAATTSLSGSVSGISSWCGGVNYVQAGSGVSGASAYLQWAITGNSGAGVRFNAQVFRADDWGV